MKWLSWFQGGRAGKAVLDRPKEEKFLWHETHEDKSTAPYFLPNDAREINRLDFQHFLVRYAVQRNYVAPIQYPKSILDVGSGTGRWAHEMATQFPRSKVFGLDIDSSSSRADNTIPTNYRFVAGNVLKELPFPDMTFDFVHQRFLHMALPVNSWNNVVQELVRITRSEGWVELVESDLIMHNAGPAIQKLTEWGFDVARTRGIDPRVSINIGNFLNAAGLSNIQTYRIDLPIGSWGGRLGNLTASDMVSYNQAMKPKITERFKVSSEEYDRISLMMRKEWESNRCYFSLFFAYGQKQ